MKNIDFKKVIIGLLVVIAGYFGWDLVITPKEDSAPVMEAVDTTPVFFDSTVIDTIH